MSSGLVAYELELGAGDLSSVLCGCCDEGEFGDGCAGYC